MVPHSSPFAFESDGRQLTIQILSDRMDSAIADTFKASVSQYWHSDITLVEVDLESVVFMDSSGVGALISLQRRLKNTADPVRLVQVQPSVVKIIELLRLQNVFAVYPAS